MVLEIEAKKGAIDFSNSSARVYNEPWPYFSVIVINKIWKKRILLRIRRFAISVVHQTLFSSRAYMHSTWCRCSSAHRSFTAYLGTKLKVIWTCTMPPASKSRSSGSLTILQYGRQGISISRSILIARWSACANMLYGNAYTTRPEIAMAAMAICLCASTAPSMDLNIA